jgi:hypothetical protein
MSVQREMERLTVGDEEIGPEGKAHFLFHVDCVGADGSHLRPAAILTTWTDDLARWARNKGGPS